MKTLLIVEDEKSIRMGILAMVRRAPVEIETILDCQNGAEALEILSHTPVDVMITDIRMPKMDGLELVRQAGTMEHPPKMVVISGYDEFSFAVDMLRNGVRDYLLKPVEREQVFALLSRLEGELAAEARGQAGDSAALSHVLRSLVLGGGLSPAEVEALNQRYSGDFVAGSYRALCLPPGCHPQVLPPCHKLERVEGHTLLLVPQGEGAVPQQAARQEDCPGISGVHRGFGALRLAYEEAAQARSFAFLQGRAVSSDAPEVQNPIASPQEGMEGEWAQVLQLLGSSQGKEAGARLGSLLLLAQNGALSPQGYIQGMAALCTKILGAFGSLLEEEARELLAHPLSFPSAFAHYTALRPRLEECFGQGDAQGEQENRQKILRAMAYLQNRYRGEVNMAMASNHISMNYTQFSYLFKHYTGSNFSDYLRSLRLEEGKRLLRETDEGIKQISRLCGFKNEKHFMKAFKQVVGVSPGAYRRSCTDTGDDSTSK